MIQAHEARVNVTYHGQNFELPDPVAYQAGDGDIRAWASEAIRAGSVPGIAADPNVDLTNFVVDRFDTPVNPAAGQRDHNLIQVRPKTAFGEADISRLPVVDIHGDTEDDCDFYGEAEVFDGVW